MILTRPSSAILVLFAFAPAFAQPTPLPTAPPGPVARPVDPDKTASSRVVVAVQPVGRVAYDGLTLPVTSPSGEFIASQTGRAPSWDALLGAGVQTLPAGVRLAINQIEFPTAAPPAKGKDAKSPATRPTPHLTLLEPANPLPTGLLLGRGGDDIGFIVEAPQADGSRWIGRVHWIGQKLEWLVKSADVCAQATLAPPATDGVGAIFAYIQRPALPDGPFTRLVVRVRGGDAIHSVEQTFGPGESLAFPIFSPDGRTVAVILTGASGAGAGASGGAMRLVAFDLRKHPSTGLPELVEIGRLDLGAAPIAPADQPGASQPLPVIATLHHAYQCVAALQTPPVLPALDAAASVATARQAFAAGLTVFSPRDGAVVWWNPREDQVVSAERGSFAAVPFQHTGFGLLIAGPGLGGSSKPVARSSGGGAPPGATGAGGPATAALTYQPMTLPSKPSGAQPLLGRAVEVVAGRMIPRASSRSHEGVGLTVLLAAPKSAAEDSFEILLLAPGTPE